MILFALTSDIKQSTDYADLDSLLYGISNGDKKCLEQLYQVTHTSVYSFALSVLKNHHDAEDEGAQESGMYIAGRLGTCYPGY